MGSVAHGQQAPDAAKEAASSLTRVEVTGSRIKRIESVGASATQSLSRADIDASGADTLDELLRNLPAAGSGSFALDQPAVSLSAFGASGISLRGLGTNATLVLINGRRVAPFGFGNSSFVNTAAIPLSAIERVDVLLDGASAIYGADAIGGVVNNVLRKTYNGAEITGGVGQSVYSDNERATLGATWGRSTTGPGAYNVLVNYTHTEQRPVRAVDRLVTMDGDYNEYGLSSYMTAAYRNVYNLSKTTGVTPTSFIGQLTKTATPCQQATAATPCMFNPTSVVNLVNRRSSDSLFMTGSLDLGGGIEVFGDASLYRDSNQGVSFSYDTGSYRSYTDLQQDRLGQFGNAKNTRVNFLILAPGHPQNPTASSFVGVRYRYDDVLRNLQTDSLNQRYTLGVRGEYAGWDLESALVVSRSETKQANTGFLNDKVFRNEVLDTNGYVKNSFILGNPALNDPGLMERLYPTLRSRAVTEVDSLDVRAVRELWQLPAGAVGLAVGAEVRRERAASIPDPLLNTDQLALVSQYAVDGSRTSNAVYAELAAPVLKDLELTLAARRDSYSDFGVANTPKVGAKWTVVPGRLVLRSTYAEGFRAPTLPETQIRKTSSFSTVQDPKRCPVFVSGAPGCADFVQSIAGQDGQLLPETSKSLTLGMVLQPSNNISLSVDGYLIKRHNELSSLTAQQVLDLEDQWPQRVVRDSSGQILSVTRTTGNLGDTTVRGVDTEGKISIPLDDGLGTLTFTANYSHTYSYAYSAQPGAEVLQYVGYYLRPRERASLSASWRVADWTFNVTSNQVGAYLWQSGPQAACSQKGKAAEHYCLIPKWGTASAFISYTGFNNIKLSLSVRDLENRGAPLDGSKVGYFTGYNSTYHSAIGRNVTLSGTYKF